MLLGIGGVASGFLITIAKGGWKSCDPRRNDELGERVRRHLDPT